MDDIRAERYMISCGNVQLVCVPKYAVLAVGELFGVNVYVLAECLAVSQVELRAALNCLVHPRARLLPHSE